MVVADRAAMISGMAPVLTPGRFVFCSFPHEASVEAMTAAIAMFREAEGVSLILPAALSPPGAMPVRGAARTSAASPAMKGQSAFTVGART